MKQHKYLFIDRDGTIIIEPEDKQIDHIDKLDFLPGVFDAHITLQQAGFKLVMVSNQDGLGTSSFPESDFNAPHELILRVLKSQGIIFEDILIGTMKSIHFFFVEKIYLSDLLDETF